CRGQLRGCGSARAACGARPQVPWRGTDCSAGGIPCCENAAATRGRSLRIRPETALLLARTRKPQVAYPLAQPWYHTLFRESGNWHADEDCAAGDNRDNRTESRGRGRGRDGSALRSTRYCVPSTKTETPCVGSRWVLSTSPQPRCERGGTSHGKPGGTS